MPVSRHLEELKLGRVNRPGIGGLGVCVWCSGERSWWRYEFGNGQQRAGV